MTLDMLYSIYGMFLFYGGAHIVLVLIKLGAHQTWCLGRQLNLVFGQTAVLGRQLNKNLGQLEFQIKAWANIVHLAEKQIKASK